MLVFHVTSNKSPLYDRSSCNDHTKADCFSFECYCLFEVLEQQELNFLHLEEY